MLDDLIVLHGVVLDRKGLQSPLLERNIDFTLVLMTFWCIFDHGLFHAACVVHKRLIEFVKPRKNRIHTIVQVGHN